MAYLHTATQTLPAWRLVAIEASLAALQAIMFVNTMRQSFTSKEAQAIETAYQRFMKASEEYAANHAYIKTATHAFVEGKPVPTGPKGRTLEEAQLVDNNLEHKAKIAAVELSQAQQAAKSKAAEPMRRAMKRGEQAIGAMEKTMDAAYRGASPQLATAGGTPLTASQVDRMSRSHPRVTEPALRRRVIPRPSMGKDIYAHKGTLSRVVRRGSRRVSRRGLMD